MSSHTNVRSRSASPPREKSGKPLSQSGSKVDTAKDMQFRVDSDVKSAAVSHEQVWLSHADGSMTVRQVRTSEVLHRFAPRSARPWCLLAVSRYPNADHIFVGLSNGDIEAYDADSRKCLCVLSRHTGGIYCLAEFNGQLFSGSNDFEIMQWDANSFRFVRQLTGHSNYVRALFAEGSLLISGSDDLTVRVWNVHTGQQLSTGKFHATGVSALCRVGVNIWSGDDNGKICVWRMQNLEQVSDMQEHHGRVTTMKKIGSKVYSGSTDHAILVWDPQNFTVVQRVAEHRGWILTLLCPAQLSRYYVWSAAADGLVQCWHHDEYRPMSADFERFDDMCLYNSSYSPYKELNDSLHQHVVQAEATIQHLQRELNVALEQSIALQGAHQQLTLQQSTSEENLHRTTEEFLQTRKLLEATSASLLSKDAELAVLNEKLKKAVCEAIDDRAENVKLKTRNEELTRTLEVTKTDRDKLDRTLAEMVRLQNAALISTGKSTIIVSNEVEAKGAIDKLQGELIDALKLNESLRGDVQRYKDIIFSAESSPDRKTPKTKQRIAGSPNRVQGDKQLFATPRPPSEYRMENWVVEAPTSAPTWSEANITSYVRDRVVKLGVCGGNHNFAHSPRAPIGSGYTPDRRSGTRRVY